MLSVAKSVTCFVTFFYPLLGPHNCSLNNGLCSDLCLLKPGGYQCACPMGIVMKSDGKTCDYGKASSSGSSATLREKKKKKKKKTIGETTCGIFLSP